MPPKKSKEGSSEASAPKRPRVNYFPFDDKWLDNAPQEHRRMWVEKIDGDDTHLRCKWCKCHV